MKLTKKQYQQIAKTLLGTQLNVYSQAKLLFGEKCQWTDTDFDALEKHAGIFRCEHCSEWQDIKEERSQIDVDSCVDCFSDMEASDE